MSQNLNRLAQTRAIVAQVEREVAEQARREQKGGELVLVARGNSSKASFPGRTAYRVVTSLFPAGF